MQKLTQIISEAKKGGAGDNAILNIIREYLQVLILKAIYRSKYGNGLSFMGGTCLRICHNLKRFSEDLDFALDRHVAKYSFSELNEIIVSFLKNTNFDVSVKVSEDKVVQKSFIGVGKILHFFGLSPLQAQKIHVKLEVDTRPVKVSNKDIETFFVSKFDELFPILKHTDETMFAGKICAVFNRAYTKGRDFYDLIWYLNRRTEINLTYINDALRQMGVNKSFRNRREVIIALDTKIKSVDVNLILKDLGRFLQDPSDETWIKSYHAVFKQAAGISG